MGPLEACRQTLRISCILLVGVPRVVVVVVDLPLGRLLGPHSSGSSSQQSSSPNSSPETYATALPAERSAHAHCKLLVGCKGARAARAGARARTAACSCSDTRTLQARGTRRAHAPGRWTRRRTACRPTTQTCPRSCGRGSPRRSREPAPGRTRWGPGPAPPCTTSGTAKARCARGQGYASEERRARTGVKGSMP